MPISHRLIFPACTLLGLSFLPIAGHTQQVSGEHTNVLLITIDDLNAWVGHLEVNTLALTPNIDKLAAGGLTFTNAYTAAPVCASSRAAMMSGIAPHNSGLYTNAGVSAHQAIDYVPHLAQAFKAAGYKTLAAGKIYHQWVTDSIDGSEIKDHYDDFLPRSSSLPSKTMLPLGYGYGGTDGGTFYPFPDHNPLVEKLNIKKGVSLVAGPVKRSSLVEGTMPDEKIADWVNTKLKQYKAEYPAQPFFMAVGFMRPHVPFAVPQQYFDRFPLDSIALPKVDDMQDIPAYGKAMTTGLIPQGDHQAVTTLGERYWKQLIQGYLASIYFIDEQVGKVIDTLHDSDLADSTLIVLTSDHGQNLGEKQNWRKMSLWRESTRVPLVIRQPKNRHHKGNIGEKVNRPVSLLDIYPTLVAYTGIETTHNRFDGNNIMPLLQQPTAPWHKPVLTSWMYKNFSVSSENFRYIQYRDGSEELYDLTSDPLESHNIAAMKSSKEVINELKQHIPEDVALPFGTTKWQGDILDKRIIK